MAISGPGQGTDVSVRAGRFWMYLGSRRPLSGTQQESLEGERGFTWAGLWRSESGSSCWKQLRMGAERPHGRLLTAAQPALGGRRRGGQGWSVCRAHRQVGCRGAGNRTGRDRAFSKSRGCKERRRVWVWIWPFGEWLSWQRCLASLHMQRRSRERVLRLYRRGSESEGCG